MRDWTNPAEKGQSHNQPKGKEKGKRKGNGKNPGKGNHNQAPEEEAGQRKLDDFAIKRERVQFVGDVQERDDGIEMPGANRAAYACSVHSCRNVMSKCPEMPSSCEKVVQSCTGVRSQRPLMN